MRLATILFLLVAWPGAALAIQPKEAERAPAAGEPTPLGVDESEPDIVRMRREMQEEYRQRTEERKRSFDAAAAEFAPRPADSVPGWKDSASRVTSLSLEGDDANPLRLGPWVLGFAGIAAVLVALLKLPAGWTPFRRRDEAEEEAPKRRLADGPQTVTLRPRETRWSKDAPHG